MELHNPAPEDLAAWQPEYCVYWSEALNPSQFDIWLPYFTRLPNRIVVWTDSGRTTPQDVLDLALPNIAFVDSNYPRDAILSLRTIRAFLHITHKVRNFARLLDAPHVAHVHLGHGDSGKLSNTARELALYDHLVWANQRAVHRFPLPTRVLVKWKSHFMGATFLEPHDSPEHHSSDPQTLLYQPTWEGWREDNNYTSIDEMAGPLGEILDAPTKAKLVVRPHPGAGQRRDDVALALHKIQNMFPVIPAGKAQDFLESDAAICDVSGAAVEYLSTLKPIIVPLTQRLRDRGIERGELEALMPYAYVWDMNAESLPNAVARAFADTSLAVRRQKAFDEWYLGNRCLDDSVRALAAVLESAKRRRLLRPPRWLLRRMTGEAI